MVRPLGSKWMLSVLSFPKPIWRPVEEFCYRWNRGPLFCDFSSSSAEHRVCHRGLHVCSHSLHGRKTNQQMSMSVCDGSSGRKMSDAFADGSALWRGTPFVVCLMSTNTSITHDAPPQFAKNARSTAQRMQLCCSCQPLFTKQKSNFTGRAKEPACAFGDVDGRQPDTKLKLAISSSKSILWIPTKFLFVSLQ